MGIDRVGKRNLLRIARVPAVFGEADLLHCSFFCKWRQRWTRGHGGGSFPSSTIILRIAVSWCETVQALCAMLYFSCSSRRFSHGSGLPDAWHASTVCIRHAKCNHCHPEWHVVPSRDPEKDLPVCRNGPVGRRSLQSLENWL